MTNSNRADPDHLFEKLALIRDAGFTKYKGKPLPPWIATPFADELEWPGGDVGTQQNYWGYFYSKYWIKLNFDEKVNYFKRFDLGREWSDRGQWFHYCFEFESDEDYENLYYELEIG